MDEEILRLLPHRPPMVLIDKVLEYSENSGKGLYKVKDDCPFLDSNQFFPDYILPECFAQTVGAVSGKNIVNKGQEVKESYLVGIKSFQIFQKVKNGDTLITQVQEEAVLKNVYIFSGTIKRDNDIIAEGILKFYLG